MSVHQVLIFFVRWSGSHIRWGQPFRLRHVTTGKYLSLMEDKNLLLMDKEKADVKSTAFTFRSSKVRQKIECWISAKYIHHISLDVRSVKWIYVNMFYMFSKFPVSLSGKTHFLNHRYLSSFSPGLQFFGYLHITHPTHSSLFP